MCLIHDIAAQTELKENMISREHGTYLEGTQNHS